MTFGQTQQPPVPESNTQVIAAVELYNAGKLDDAIRLLESTTSADPNNADALSWLGFVHIRKNDHGKAVAPLESALGLRPNDLEILVNLGNAYLSTGNSQKALTTYEKVVSLKPDMAEAWYNIGNLHLTNKDSARSITALRRAIELNRNDAFAWNNLGVAYGLGGDKKQAAQAYVTASGLKTDNLLFAKNAGYANYDISEWTVAAAHLERAITNGDDDARTRAALSDIYLRQGRKQESLAMMKEAESVLGGDKAFWFNRGVLSSEMGGVEGAEAAYLRALAIDANHADSLNNLGYLYFEQERYQDAVNIYTRLYNLNKDNRGAQLSLSASYLRAGQMPQAMDLWKQILRAQPNRNAVRLDLATAQWEAGEYENSRFHFNYALKQDPTSARANNGVGMWNHRNAKFAAAEANFRAAIRSDRRYIPAYNNLAIVLEKMNRREEAIKILESALAIDANSKEVKENLDRLKAAIKR